MRSASILTIFAALTFAPASAVAQSRDYPFCAYGGKTSEGMRCDYATLAQCQASTAGDGGSCIANPRAGRAAAGGSAQR
jgi:hypothetical protein